MATTNNSIMRKVNVFILSLFLCISLTAQTNSKGTITDKKTAPNPVNYYDFEVYIGEIEYGTKNENTITHSQLVKSKCSISFHSKGSCKEKYTYQPLSWDELINKKTKIHCEESGLNFPTNYFKIMDTAKTITFSDIAIKVTTKDKKDTIIFATPKTYYILSD